LGHVDFAKSAIIKGLVLTAFDDKAMRSHRVSDSASCMIVCGWFLRF